MEGKLNKAQGKLISETFFASTPLDTELHFTNFLITKDPFHTSSLISCIHTFDNFYTVKNLS